MEVRILPCAPFLWVKLVQEEHRAWNAEASGRSTLPRPIPLSFNGRTPRSERGNGGSIPSRGANAGRWRSVNAAVCKTAMSVVDTRPILQSRPHSSTGKNPVF